MSRLFSAALALLMWTAVLPAGAHSLSVAHLDVTDDGGRVTADLDLAVRDLALAFPLDANADERVTWSELQAAYPAILAEVRSNVRFGRGVGRCDLTAAPPALRRYDDGAYARFLLAGRCPGTGPLTVDYGMFFDRDPQHRVVATFREGGTTRADIGTSSDRRLGGSADAAGMTPWAFFREGIGHILEGYDHLAFVLLLLLPAVLRREGGRWVPASSFGASLLQVGGIVTAFTLAHSVTLALAALGWISAESRLVEATIAASVILAAANNIRPVVTRRLAVVGFLFGLVHGFGFAGALGELGLPTGTRLTSLLGFNLGVEVGQLAVVAALLPALFLLRTRRWYARGGMQVVSAVLGAVAIVWLIDRLG